ncbi:MAG TPA: MFS transporter [Ktedonobacterales bacterium]|jgi:MFS family permease|nr:MFS transporter [Ktedonobacterales bacterium]
MNASAPLDHSPRTATPPPTSIFNNRNFLLLWLGQTGSVFGDFVFNTTLVVWIAATLARGQSWAPLAVSGVFIAASVPPILVAPLAGALVDRMSKRAAMLGAYMVSALVTLALIPATGLLRIGALANFPLSTTTSLGAIYLAVAVLATCAQFSAPASLALLGQIVDESSRAKAMGFLQGSASLGMLLGPAIAAPLLLAFGAQWALLIDAASFAIAFGMLTTLRLGSSASATGERRAHGHLLGEMREGIVFLARSRTLSVLALVTAVAMLGAGALNALDVFFTTHNLHTPLNLYGLLSTALGVGLIGGAVLGGALAQRVGLTRTIWMSTIAIGALVIVYAQLNSFGAAVVALFVMGIPLATLDVAGGPLLLRETPARLVGRVASLLTPLSTVATLAGAALAGWLDSGPLAGFSTNAFGMTFGPVDTIFCVAGALILGSGVYAMLGLRGADRRAQLEPPNDSLTEEAS